MRLFLGISSADLTTQVLDDMCEQHAVIRPHLAQDRHMTLCFLGEYSDEQQQKLILALDSKMKETPLCSIQWRGESICSFPHDGPKAWAWLGALTPSLESLMTQICELPMLQAQGYLTRFIPHVTLAYIGIAEQGYPDARLERDVHFTQLTLYCSLAERERTKMPLCETWAQPKYKKLKTWEL